MAKGIYPDAIQDPGNDAGEYTDNGEPKGLIHTTEGKTYASAKASYKAKNTWPQFTGTYEAGHFQIFQHANLFRAGRALRNLAGGTETNTDRVAQIELVGTCDTSKRDWGQQYVENFPKEYLEGVAKWMRWVEGELGVPRKSTVRFLPYPPSYGNNGVRLTGSGFDLYSGWLGHMHAPENVHGDPGLINMTYLISWSPPVPTEPGDDDLTAKNRGFIVVDPEDGTGAWWHIDGEWREWIRDADKVGLMVIAGWVNWNGAPGTWSKKMIDWFPLKPDTDDPRSSTDESFTITAEQVNKFLKEMEQLAAAT